MPCWSPKDSRESQHTRQMTDTLGRCRPSRRREQLRLVGVEIAGGGELVVMRLQELGGVSGR